MLSTVGDGFRLSLNPSYSLLIAAALGEVARARGMTEIVHEAGISREAMYKAFRPEGNRTLETLARVVRALGLKLSVRAA
jgi:probable addiction module antidote protein